MGGKIGVFSEGLGHGSTFFLELQIVASPLSALKPKILLDLTKSIVIDSDCVSPNLESILDLYGVCRKVRLLIVDDSVSCRKMVSQLLNKFNVESEEAIDGEDAFNRVMKGDEAFDGIIMDGEMPRMNGLQAVEAIRALGFTGRIYGCTGDTDPKMEAAFIAAGANRSYLKPLTHLNFTAMLRGTVSSPFNIFAWMTVGSIDLSEFLIFVARDQCAVENTRKAKT